MSCSILDKANGKDDSDESDDDHSYEGISMINRMCNSIIKDIHAGMDMINESDNYGHVDK